ncbi:MAG: zinc metalloprotease HtpX [Bryobacterales bacterium]|nr:zinc metalloprotease HtpX [Bryobacterales bacterium]
MNGLKTVFLLGLMSSILLFGGRAIAGEKGLYVGLAMAIGMNFFSYFFSEKMALMMSGAQPLSPSENSDIYYRVAPLIERLTQRMGLPMPKLWVTPEDSPNAFATGRNPNHSSVAVTAGLVRLMNEEELEGVIAHELGHIKNRDILISSVAATIASAISFLGQMAFFFGGRRSDDEDAPNPIAAMLMFLLAPIAAMIIQMAISRTREFSADATAAKYTGSPYGLINALRKLDSWAQRIPMDAPPSTAHMWIMKPFGGGGMMRLFSTHPATEERIAALQRLA